MEAALKFVTKSQLSSARIAIAIGCNPVATVDGVNAVTAPEIGLIFSWLTVFDNIPST